MLLVGKRSSPASLNAEKKTCTALRCINIAKNQEPADPYTLEIREGILRHQVTGGVRPADILLLTVCRKQTLIKSLLQLWAEQPPSLPSPPLASHGIGNALLRGLGVSTLRPDEKVFDVNTDSFLHAVEQPRQTDLKFQAWAQADKCRNAGKGIRRCARWTG